MEVTCPTRRVMAEVWRVPLTTHGALPQEGRAMGG